MVGSDRTITASYDVGKAGMRSLGRMVVVVAGLGWRGVGDLRSVPAPTQDLGGFQQSKQKQLQPEGIFSPAVCGGVGSLTGLKGKLEIMEETSQVQSSSEL